MSDSPEHDNSDSPKDKPAVGGSGCLRGMMFLGVLLVGLVAAAPTIASQTELGDTLLAKVGEQLPPGSKVGGVSLGWFSPVAARDVVLRDESGQELMVAQVETDTPLWKLLWNQQLPTKLTFRGIELTVDLDTLETKTGDGGEDSNALPSFGGDGGSDALPAVSVSDATVHLKNGPLTGPVDLKLTSIDLGQPTDGVRPVSGSGTITTANVEREFTLGGSWSLDAMAGEVTLDVPAADVGATLATLKPTQSYGISGRGTLKLTVTRKEEQPWNGTFGFDGESLGVAGPPELKLAEPKLLVRGSFDETSQAAVLETMKLGSDLIKADLTGRWSFAPDDVAGTLDGRIDVDGRLLRSLGAPPEIGVEAVSLTDIHIEPMPAEQGEGLRGGGKVEWPGLSLYGLAGGRGRADWGMAGNVYRVQLTEAPLGGGMARGTYDLTLDDVPTVSFAGGPVLENVTLTENLTRDWLQYVSPAMARATDVTGQFSLALGPVTSPLSGPPSPTNGALTIHQASMTSGPVLKELMGRFGVVADLAGAGPRMQQLANFGDGRQIVTLPPQQVRFAVQPQGVSHEQFVLQSGQVSITTGGYVGFDQSLQLMAVVLPPAADPNKPVLAAMAAQPIELPIVGTIERPQLQRGTLKEAGKRAAAGAIDGLLQKLGERRNRRR